MRECLATLAIAGVRTRFDIRTRLSGYKPRDHLTTVQQQHRQQRTQLWAPKDQRSIAVDHLKPPQDSKHEHYQAPPQSYHHQPHPERPVLDRGLPVSNRL